MTIKPDTENFFSKKFLQHFLKKGKKSKAHKILYKALREFDDPKHLILPSLFEKIKPFLEVRSVRVRRFTNMVPFPVNERRQMHLSSKWILESIKKDKRRVPSFLKLKEEFSQILSSKGETLKKKKSFYQLALKNRSNMHYRWY